VCGSAEGIQVTDVGGVYDTVWILGCYQKGCTVLRKEGTAQFSDTYNKDTLFSWGMT